MSADHAAVARAFSFELADVLSVSVVARMFACKGAAMSVLFEGPLNWVYFNSSLEFCYTNTYYH